MTSKFKEIFKLKNMLEKEGIPFDWIPNWGYSPKEIESMEKAYPDLIDHYQICYPSKGDDQWISVIGGFGVFGEEKDELEIMGGFTPLEEKTMEDSVLGYLTARNVFNRIKKHYMKEKKEEIKVKKIVRYIDEDTLEIKEMELELDDSKEFQEEMMDLLQTALNCDPSTFIDVYDRYKTAEKEFNAIYEPFKENLIKIYETHPEFMKNIIIGNAKLTYVSPNTRKTIDTKKLKEEEPSIAEKYTKSTDVKATIRLENIIKGGD